MDEQGQHLIATSREIEEGTPNIADANLIEKIIGKRHSGLRENEFCPLGETWWNDNPDLVQRLEKRYNEYRQKVVMPLR